MQVSDYYIDQKMAYVTVIINVAAVPSVLPCNTSEEEAIVVTDEPLVSSSDVTTPVSVLFLDVVPIVT